MFRLLVKLWRRIFPGKVPSKRLTRYLEGSNSLIVRNPEYRDARWELSFDYIAAQDEATEKVGLRGFWVRITSNVNPDENPPRFDVDEVTGQIYMPPPWLFCGQLPHQNRQQPPKLFLAMLASDQLSAKSHRYVTEYQHPHKRRFPLERALRGIGLLRAGFRQDPTKRLVRRPGSVRQRSRGNHHH